MARYRSALPQCGDTLFLTDGGLETTLVFHQGIDLPCFAAFPLVVSETGREQLRAYYRPYLETARERDIGFVLDTPTWRANADWGERLGYDLSDLAEINRASVELMADLRREYEMANDPIVINGAIGPRGDGYKANAMMTADEAYAYHSDQIDAFRDTDADMVTAFTLTYIEEAIGIARAARNRGMPVVISFTVETDGRLPSGHSLESAIHAVDSFTGWAPAYYMINCAHPQHFSDALARREPWLDRIRGIRANASARSHEELDNATDLDAGDPVDLGQRYRALRKSLRRLSVVGGCCGTDHRHIRAICDACLAPPDAKRTARQSA
jgi:S-methylmethionine-dependent homocysteine/selenocysteine methylase